ncbi:ComEA family DNA-binding protein [Microbacterium sp. ET2]|uniref:ComEA family DNA-binding protein n=1 Tax=Microbacterium albipurpureum TaxID=3050384 RepID=UPI00259C8A9A|nr:ComEA family DNA-binding protein [Microbacterium sp. ET2 (Ac-2212)]WJL95683.1 ComEA family DNA-binding protein [Microbacterium sp. ET2 (Ac-2212)]
MTADGEEGRHTARRVGLGAAVVVVLAAVALTVGIGVLRSALGPVEDVPLPSGTVGVSTGEEGTESVPPAPSADLVVHVAGAVATPGVYVLPDRARVLDAVAAAGGFTETAEPRSVNLARLLADGEQLVVAEIGDVTLEQPPGTAAGGAPDTTGGKVNLNTADEAALDTLPRIGPALAERIIAWRESNGPFTSVDDLLAVSGFGEKMVESLRDLVVW